MCQVWNQMKHFRDQKSKITNKWYILEIIYISIFNWIVKSLIISHQYKLEYNNQFTQLQTVAQTTPTHPKWVVKYSNSIQSGACADHKSPTNSELNLAIIHSKVFDPSQKFKIWDPSVLIGEYRNIKVLLYHEVTK